MQEQYLIMREKLLHGCVAFSEEQICYMNDKFRAICDDALTGDANNNRFDSFCEKIQPFCEEIYQMGKDLKWPADLGETLESPNDAVIYNIGACAEAYILPQYKKYLKKSESLYKMVCDVIREEKYDGGRCSFINLIWPKTGKTEGIDVKRLLKSPNCCNFTVDALLKLRDGRFVKEVQKLQETLPKDTWIVWRKKIALYIERYGEG